LKNKHDPDELLRNTKVVVSPQMFTLVSLTRDEWMQLLQDPASSPRMTAPFMIFMDEYEVTLLLDETDFETVLPSLKNSKTERGFRMMTFDTVMDFNVVGFLAQISKVLAEAGVPIFSVSAFSRDHILVKQDHLVLTLRVLVPFVSQLC
jgi:hypothetical protein